MKTKWNKSTLFNIVLLLPFFKPFGLTYYSIINTTFQLLKLVSIAIILLILALDIKNVTKINYGVIGLLSFWVIYITNSYIYRTNYFDIINNGITSFLILSYINYMIRKGQKNIVIDSLSKIFITYIILQIISITIIHMGIILFEPLINDYTYFLGTDNYSAFSIIPMLGIITFNSLNKKNEIGKVEWFCIALIVFFNFYTRSIAALIATLYVLAFLKIHKFGKRILASFSITKVIMISSIFVFLVVYLNFQNIFSWFIEIVLQKNITLNSRTIIWNNALALIKKKPILGYGVLSINQINSYALYGTSHAHNFLLELLLRTGIIGTIGYITFIVWPIRKKWKLYINNKSYVLIIALIAQVLLFVADFYPTMPYFYAFMAILYNAKHFLGTQQVVE